MSDYIHQGTGGRFWNWRHGAARGIRAGETRELGGMGDSPIIRAGIPEPLTGLGDLGSSARLLTIMAGLGAIFWVGSKVMGKRTYKKNPAPRRRRRRKARRMYRR